MQNDNKTVTQTEYGKIIAGSLLIIATIAFTIALKYTATVLIPFVLALFIYYLILPLITVLNISLKFPRWLATLVSLVIIVLTFSILIPFLNQFESKCLFSPHCFYLSLIKIIRK